MKNQLFNANCIEVIKTLKDNSIDAIITDPPYGLKFMNRDWDKPDNIVFTSSYWKEVFRVLKPGGHILSFSGSRTYHWLATAIEKAGFEIRDQIMWLYASGFPKGRNIARAIDKEDKFEGEVIGKFRGADNGSNAIAGSFKGDYFVKSLSPKAQPWEGWNTNLKPSHEPIVMARKPIEKGLTIAQNCLKWGVGAINIDECRVPFEDGDKTSMAGKGQIRGKNVNTNLSSKQTPSFQHKNGRHPANIIHDGSKEVVNQFPVVGRSTSRFFYSTKASPKDRDEGLGNFEDKQIYDGVNQHYGYKGTLGDKLKNVIRKNNHPTVKPTALMEYLIKLITPKGGVILDPFMGSGSTGKAANRLKRGYKFIGVELNKDYFELAKARIEYESKEIQELTLPAKQDAKEPPKEITQEEFKKTLDKPKEKDIIVTKEDKETDWANDWYESEWDFDI